MSRPGSPGWRWRWRCRRSRPLALVMIRLAVHRLKLPLMLAAPIVWVALEYVRAYIFTGFPWYYLAHSQHAILPVIQIADFAGSLGVSMVIVAVNAWIVDLLSLPLLCPGTARPRLTNAQVRRLVAVACFVLGTLAYVAIGSVPAPSATGPAGGGCFSRTWSSISRMLIPMKRPSRFTNASSRAPWAGTAEARSDRVARDVLSVSLSC